MATQNNVNVNVNVSDNGTTAKVNKEAKQYKATLDDITKVAPKVAASFTPKFGGTAGSRAASSSASTSTPTSTSRPAGITSREVMSDTSYNAARGTAGVTGASARDFAKQSRDLDGLVRVYATFAANIYAVGAAFRALSEAAATDNLIKGLDSLGVASGKNLGSLSKQLVDATEGAISLKDAMTTVATASSAGIKTDQIKDIAIVASKASQALGVNMADAISRLSRGITKIEPELLDELGIFVKVDEATTKYALSVGKTTAALSDFEKRQAFANAVIDEGKKKFAAIETSANPYDKLLASVSNLSTQGLSLLNKVLGPIVDMLAQSPTALLGIFTAVGTLLLKQAIPALGQFRAGLRASADEALEAAKAYKASFGDKFQDLLEKRFQIPTLQANVDRAQQALDKLEIPKKLPGSVKDLSNALTNGTEASTKSLENSKRVLAERNKLLKDAADSTKQLSEAQTASAKKDIDYINALLSAYKERQKLEEGWKNLQAQADKPQGKLDPEILAYTAYAKLKRESQKADIVATAAQNAQLIGIRGSWALLNKEISDNGLKGWDKYVTQVKGGTAAVVSRIMGIVSAFGYVGEAIGAAVAVFSILDSVLSKAAKQQAEFNAKTEESNKTIELANKTIDLYTKKLAYGFSTEGITAFTNALSGISKNLEDQASALDAFVNKAGVWDTLKDKVSSIWGGSNLDKLKNTTSAAIGTVVKTLQFSSQGAAGRTSLANILKLDPKDLDNAKLVSKSIQDMSEVDLSHLRTQIAQISKEQEASTNSMNAFTESAKEVDKLFSQMAQANAFTDIQGKIGVELVNSSIKLGQVLREDPLKALQDISALAKDTKFTALLGSDGIGLQQATKLVESINAAKNEQEKRQVALDKAKKEFADAEAEGWGEYGKNVLDAAQNAFDTASKNLDSLKSSADSIMGEYSGLVKQISDEGFRRVQLGLKNAREMAAISVEQAKLPLAASAGMDTSKREADLARQELELQRQQIEASYQAQLRQMENTDSVVALTASIDALRAAEALKTAEKGSAEYKSALLVQEAANKAQTAAAAKTAVKKGDKEMLKLLPPEAVAAARTEVDSSKKILQAQRDAALASINAKEEITRLNERNKANDYALKASQEDIDLKKKSFELSQSILGVIGAQNSELTTQIAETNTKLQAEIITKDVEKERGILNKKLTDLELSRAIDPKSYAAEKARTEEAKKQLNISEGVKLLANDIKGIQSKYTIEVQETTIAQDAALQSLNNTNQVQEAKLSLMQKEIDMNTQLGAYTERMSAAKRAQVELQQQNLKYSEQELKLKSDISIKQLALDAAISEQTRVKEFTDTNVANKNITQEDADRLNQLEEKRVNTAKQQLVLSNSAAATAAVVNDLTVEGIKNTAAMNDKLLEQKELFDNIASITASLSGVFGTLGESVGKFAEALAKSGAQSEANSKALEDNRKLQEDLIKQQDKGYDVADKLNQAKEDGATLAKKSAKDELNSNIAIVASAKKMFGEKTAAAKALGAVEKVLHIQRIAMDMKELVQKLFTDSAETASTVTAQTAQTAVTEAGFLARTGTYISEIFAKFTATMGPWGWAAAAAVVAAIFGGKGGGNVPFVATAEQQQKVQGTAMSYDNTGKLVQTSRGVFGDTEAKSESIANSLKLIEETSVAGLSYYNQMLSALKQIRDNIGSAAKGLYNIPGLRAGSLSGTIEGTNTSGGLLGIGGLFSSSTTKEIIDSGIKLAGTFGDLVRGVGNTIQTFETVSTTVKKSGFFGIGASTSTSVSTEYKDLLGLDPKSFQALVDSLGNANSLLLSIAKTANIDLATVQAKLDSLTVDKTISLRGLTGEAFTKELSTVIGQILDDASQAIFSQFEQFAQFGEGMLETVVRVIDSNTKVKQALQNSFIDISSVINMQGYTISEALVNLAGGLQNFLDAATFYQENFLTERERLTPVLKATGDELGRIVGLLGYKVPDGVLDTREEFTKLVKSLDLTTTTGQEAYTALMNVAPGFDKLMDYVDEFTSQSISKISDLAKAFKDFAKQISEFRTGLLLGSLSTATPLEKLSTAKTEYSKILTAAMGGDKDALGKLTSSANTYLELAKSAYASSSTYTDIFNTVTAQLGDVEQYATDTADLAQQQVDALNSHTKILANIDSGISKLAGITPIQAAATGGWRQGITLVGEKGPEIVDFTSPGRVYTADQTAGMFAQPAGATPAFNTLISEVKQLRAELVTLRKEQQQQIGDLINTNYDATNTLADHITEAVTSSVSDTAWQARTQVVLK